MAIGAIRTNWIDGNGGEGDLERTAGRLGNDIRLFALHTLGWIQLQEILGHVEIEFDPRAAHPVSIAALIQKVRGFARASTLSFVKARAHTGSSWVTFTCTGREIESLVEWLWAMAEFGGAPTIPAALSVSDLPDRTIAADPDRTLRRVLGTWRDAGGRLDVSSADPSLTNAWGAPRPGANLKVLRRDRDGQVVFGSYQPSLTGLWESATVGRFVDARVLESVPDRALAQSVVRSALRTLAEGRPRAERCRGPCLRSDESVEERDWMRVSLPAASTATGGFDSLIVYCRSLSIEERKQMSG